MFEREALLSYLLDNVKNCIENYNEESIEKLKKIMFGSRGEYAEIESINVKTVIEKQIKEYFQDSKVMELYDEVSNLVHPNYNGVWDAYCNLDMKTLVVTLESHDKGNIKLTTLTAVYKSLGSAIIWNQRLSELLPQFTAREGDDKNELRSSLSL